MQILIIHLFSLILSATNRLHYIECPAWGLRGSSSGMAAQYAALPPAGLLSHWEGTLGNILLQTTVSTAYRTTYRGPKVCAILVCLLGGLAPP